MLAPIRQAGRDIGDRAGVIGAAVMVIEHTLGPAAVDRAIAASDAPELASS
ncbi:hypothetical protein ACGFMM_00515 [Streptomyces sp. NPDC048604]|uniref:hypothetical protein n=1 Tax=Streptomyces sp. NPDC048604 TaxID=3365578 RepID=UPI00371C72F3